MMNTNDINDISNITTRQFKEYFTYYVQLLIEIAQKNNKTLYLKRKKDKVRINTYLLYLEENDKGLNNKNGKIIKQIQQVSDVTNEVINMDNDEIMDNFQPILKKKHIEYIFKTKTVEEIMKYINFYYRYYHLGYDFSIEKHGHKIKMLIENSKRNINTVEIIKKYLDFIKINSRSQRMQLDVKNLLKKYFKDDKRFDESFYIVSIQIKEEVINYLAKEMLYAQPDFDLILSEIKQRKDIVEILKEVFVKTNINHDVHYGARMYFRDAIKKYFSDKIDELQEFNLLRTTTEPFKENKNDQFIIIEFTNYERLMTSFPMEKIDQRFYQPALEVFIDLLNNSKSEFIEEVYLGKKGIVFHLNNTNYLNANRIVEIINKYFMKLMIGHENNTYYKDDKLHYINITKDDLLWKLRINQDDMKKWITHELFLLKLNDDLIENEEIPQNKI